MGGENMQLQEFPREVAARLVQRVRFERLRMRGPGRQVPSSSRCDAIGPCGEQHSAPTPPRGQCCC